MSRTAHRVPPAMLVADTIALGDLIPDAIYLGDTELWTSGPPPPYDDVIAEDAPIAWWKLDEANAATAVVDTQGLMNLNREGTGTLGVPGIPAGGTAFDADLTGRFVTAAPWDWATFADACTIECWFKDDPANIGTLQRIMGNYNSSTLGVLQFDIPATTNRLRSFAPTGTGGLFATAPAGTNFLDGEWHHLVATREVADGQMTVKLYVDGRFQAENTFIGVPTADPNTNFRVGGYGASPASPLLGEIDQAAVYDYLLPVERIRLHHRSGAATPPAPISEYDPAEHTVPEVKDHVKTTLLKPGTMKPLSHDARVEIQRILDEERAGRNRTRLVSWLDRIQGIV